MSGTLHVTSSKDMLAIRVTLWENVFEKTLTSVKTCKKHVFCRKHFIQPRIKGTLRIKKSLSFQNIIV